MTTKGNIVKTRLAHGARYLTGFMIGALVMTSGAPADAAPAPQDVHVVTASAHLMPHAKIVKPIKPGTVRTSKGRTVKIDKRGCLFLTYAEAGDPSASDDPTDGIVLCEK